MKKNFFLLSAAALFLFSFSAHAMKPENKDKPEKHHPTKKASEVLTISDVKEQNSQMESSKIPKSESVRANAKDAGDPWAVYIKSLEGPPQKK